MKFITYICFVFYLLNGNCQTIYYEDIFQGGVTASGTSSGTWHGVYNSSIEVNIPIASSIRKAFLIFYNANNDTTKFQFILKWRSLSSA